MSVVSSSSKAASHGGAGEAGGEAEAAAPAPAPLDDDDAADDAPRTATANSKEKTPMCLVNELARYNKVSPERTSQNRWEYGGTPAYQYSNVFYFVAD